MRGMHSDAWFKPSFAHSHGNLEFSWGFGWQASRLLERLDIFFVGAWASMCGGFMMIWMGTVL